MKQNHHLNPHCQPQEELTETQKVATFILVTPILLFGAMGIFALIASAIMTIFPEGKMARNFATQESTPVEVKKVSSPAEVKRNPDCLYVPESFVPPGVSFKDYKREVKQGTGVKCLVFVGG